MRLSPLVLPILLTTATATTAAADGAAEPAAPVSTARTKMIAIDGALAMPTGKLGDGVGFGIGALARFEMPLAPKLVLTARVGYIQHFSKESDVGGGATAKSSASQIPLLGGIRYVFSQGPTTQLYGGAELGFDVVRLSFDNNGMSSSNSDTNLGMTLGGGYRTGKLDLRAGLLFPDLGNVGDAIALMATVGYDIKAL
ncbi:MAG: hypothetical protein H6Q90_4269 [Deltaproteobacteria bacterium]|nr:hypothetical protein [Deltaproteobacteria bacterium]